MAPRKQKPPPQEVNVKVDASPRAVDRVAGWFKSPVAIALGVIALVGVSNIGLTWWKDYGGTTLVGTRTIDELRNNVTTQINNASTASTNYVDVQILALKKELQAKDADIDKKLADLARDLEKAARTLWRVQLDFYEWQDQQVSWTQLQLIDQNIAGVKRQLALTDRKDDPDLTQRLAQLENVKKRAEAQITDIKDRIRRHKEQER